MAKKTRDPGSKTRSPTDNLTPREREAVDHAKSGLTTAEIAQVMRLSLIRVRHLLLHAIRHNPELKEMSDWVRGSTGIRYTPGGPPSKDLIESRRSAGQKRYEKGQRIPKPETELKPYLCRICGKTDPAEFYPSNKGLCKTCKVEQARIHRHVQKEKESN